MAQELVIIDDDDALYRRLAPHCIKPNNVVSSAAFKTRNQWDTEISVDLARLTTPRQCLAMVGNRPGFKLGRFAARVPRSLAFEVRHDPQQNSLAHCVIRGANDEHKSRAMARQMTIVPESYSSPALISSPCAIVSATRGLRAMR